MKRAGAPTLLVSSYMFTTKHVYRALSVLDAPIMS